MYFAENRRFLIVVIDNAAVRRECGLPGDSGYLGIEREAGRILR